VAKKKDRDRRHEHKRAAQAKAGTTVPKSSEIAKENFKDDAKKDEESDIEPMDVSDEERGKEDPTKTVTPATPLDQLASVESHKRKREDGADGDDVDGNDDITTPSKRTSFASPPVPPAPPPPPPPPTDSMEDQMMAEAEVADESPVVESERNLTPNGTGILEEEMGMGQSTGGHREKLQTVES
jgi:hypothetical protein